VRGNARDVVAQCDAPGSRASSVHDKGGTYGRKDIRNQKR